jgi:predicted DCC family thiol-disulfide oxidoreductase YuxK
MPPRTTEPIDGPPPWRLYYDGECNLCHRAKLRVERWAERAGQPLVALPLQGPEAAAKGYAGAMVLEAGAVYTAEGAWLRLCAIGPWPARLIAASARAPGIGQVLALGYRLVARWRYRVFGRRACRLGPVGQREPSD